MYQGYLLRVGSYTVPLKFMRAETYKITKNGQDMDSYRDADGILHRTALEHFVFKAEFNTPHTNNIQMQELLTNIRAQYDNSIEKKAPVTFYVPETDSYETQDSYMPDIEFEIYGVFNDVIEYNEVRFAFIGY